MSTSFCKKEKNKTDFGDISPGTQLLISILFFLIYFFMRFPVLPGHLKRYDLSSMPVDNPRLTE